MAVQEELLSLSIHYILLNTHSIYYILLNFVSKLDWLDQWNTASITCLSRERIILGKTSSFSNPLQLYSAARNCQLTFTVVEVYCCAWGTAFPPGPRQYTSKTVNINDSLVPHLSGQLIITQTCGLIMVELNWSQVFDFNLTCTIFWKMALIKNCTWTWLGLLLTWLAIMLNKTKSMLYSHSR